MFAWVSVSNGVPSDDDNIGFSDKVLATMSDGSLQFVYYFTDERVWVRTDGTETQEVVAWMELPQPYKKAKEKN